MSTKKIKSLYVVRPGSNPDVDTDFNTTARNHVIEHVREIYGSNNVAAIGTFSTLAAKGAFKTMCTIYEVPFAQANKIADLIPPDIEGVGCTIDDIFNPKSDRYSEGADFRNATLGEEWTKIIAGARAIEGRNKTTSVHPCFVADTQVKTSTGLKSIKDVKVGELVLTHTNSFKEVVEVMSRTGDNLYKLSTANSAETTVTGNHPFYTRRLNGKALEAPAWVNAEDLNVGVDYIGTPVNTSSELPVFEHELPFDSAPFWWVIGRSVGAGWNSAADLRNVLPLREYLALFWSPSGQLQLPEHMHNLPEHLLKNFIEGYTSVYREKNALTENIVFPLGNRQFYLDFTAIFNKAFKSNLMPVYSAPHTALYATTSDSSFYEDGFLWSETLSIEPLEGQETVYNLSVLDDSSYVADGLIAHNCGIVISSKPLMNTVPLQVRQSDGLVVTQWGYEDLESLGLIKMDFLGLDTVDLIQYTVENIMKSGKPALNMMEIIHGPMDDPKTFEMLERGDTVGVFQLASPGVQDLLKRIKPTSIDDIIATTALYRPGPMGMQSHIKYADRKNGREPIEYIHKEFETGPLKDILKNTYALIVFQEQILQIANQIGGMSLRDADDLRKAMGKKIVPKMLAMKPIFMAGGKERGYSEEAMEVLWNTIAEFAKYGFNMCLHGDTKVLTTKGMKTVSELYKLQETNPSEVIEVLSLFETGEFKAHRVANVAKTGEKPLYTVKTESGKIIKITQDHRMLTPNGYHTISNGGISVGSELIFDENWQKNTKKKLARSKVSTNEAALRKAPVAVSTDSVQISDGRWVTSLTEALAAEYFISRGVPFEIQKKIYSDNRTMVSSFYANGKFFEFDSLSRGRSFFVKAKYRDTPFVYLTPTNYKDRIDETLIDFSNLKGDKIVSIAEPAKTADGKYFAEMTYDLEMEDCGPANFVAEGLVSHNSHSVAYGINAYQAAYLKANYPVEFMAALISQNIGNKDKILTFLQEARRMGLKVGSIDVNISEVRVSPDFTKKSAFDIVYGLSGVSSVSEETARMIVEERDKNGSFKSVQDFIARCFNAGVTNKRIFENIAKAGGFDSFGVTRQSVVKNIVSLMNAAKTKGDKGADLFDMLGANSAANETASVKLDGIPEYPHIDKLKMEADVIGLYLTSHPLSNVGPGLSKARSTTIKELMKSGHRGEVRLTGAITEITKKMMRRGGKSVTVVLDDGTGYITAHLTREIIKGMDKKAAQQRVRRLYENGEIEIPDELVSVATDPDFKSIDEIEKNSVYSVKLTFRPARGDSPYGARISSIEKLNLSDDGSLPIRMRFLYDAKNEARGRKLAQALPKAIAARNPGDFEIIVALEPKSMSVEDENAVYNAAVKEMRQSSKRATEKTKSSSSPSGLWGDESEKASQKTSVKNVGRVWPPNVPKTSKEESDGPLTEERVNAVSYTRTGFKAAKTKATELDIEKYLGVESYDFGVFDLSVLED